MYEYKGIPVHAPIAVHEAAISLVRKYVGENGVVVDVGCGNGGMSQRLVDAGYETVAIDQDMSGFRAKGVREIQGDMSTCREWVDPGQEVDCVIALEVVETYF